MDGKSIEVKQIIKRPIQFTLDLLIKDRKIIEIIAGTLREYCKHNKDVDRGTQLLVLPDRIKFYYSREQYSTGTHRCQG